MKVDGFFFVIAVDCGLPTYLPTFADLYKMTL